MRSRALRSSGMVVIGFGGSNVLRLVSNLILTRLLFPEVFGLMALVYVFLTGLAMFSDIGINLSVIQNKRGDSLDFLNTAWSVQICRGLLLWLCACALGYPAALIYDQPQLGILLPVVGLTALIDGFTTTKIALANRNLQIGVQVMTDLTSQAATLLLTACLAWLFHSVWALVLGALVGTTIKVVSQHLLVRGPANRWYFDRQMAWDMMHFGKYIFLASIAGFLVNQSDRAILGRFVSLSDLGIFSIAYLFASVPIELARVAGGRIILPLFSKFPPSDNFDNRAKVLKARRFVLFATTALGGVLSIISVPMIDALYDGRYHNAGPVLALLGFSITSQVACSNYDGSYLSVGASIQHFRLIFVQAIVQVPLSLFMIARFGIIGATFALGTTMLITYPYRAIVAHRYGAWDARSDLLTFAIGWGCSLLACYLWQDSIRALATGL